MNLHLPLVMLAAVEFLSACEACNKTWEFTGTVTNASDQSPLEGVLVTGPARSNGSGRATTTTNSDGKYTITDRSYGGLEGFKFTFEKTGFSTTESTALTTEEAGIDRCGAIAITRDAALSPE